MSSRHPRHGRVKENAPSGRSEHSKPIRLGVAALEREENALSGRNKHSKPVRLGVAALVPEDRGYPRERNDHSKPVRLGLAALEPRHSQRPSSNAHGNDRRNGPASSHRYDYHAGPPRSSEPMSGGRRPPAPSPPPHNELISYRTDRELVPYRADRPPARHESASRSGYDPNHQFDIHSQERSLVSWGDSSTLAGSRASRMSQRGGSRVYPRSERGP